MLSLTSSFSPIFIEFAEVERDNEEVNVVPLLVGMLLSLVFLRLEVFAGRQPI